MNVCFGLAYLSIGVGLVSTSKNAFEIGNSAEFEWFAPVMKWNEGYRLLRRWRVTAELCRKFCYGIKTISVFRQVSESSLFPFKRRFQVNRIFRARTRSRTGQPHYLPLSDEAIKKYVWESAVGPHQE
ncbi:hypothetical protein QL285_003488 [Trifolium repens]|nr:hypothetical protein QL285_003488 [Trifolium repens]